MDEFDLIRRALGEPGDDPEALGAIRARLDAAIREQQRRTRRRRFIPAAVAAAIAATAIMVMIVGPFGGSVGAASELRRLGEIASTRAAPGVGPGESLLIDSEELRVEAGEVLGSSEFTVLARLRIQTWIASDRSWFRRTDVISAGFASEADRLAWEQAGRPEPIARAGDVRRETLGQGGFSWVDTQQLPAEPDRLHAELRAGSVARVPSGDEDLFLIVGELLSQGDAPPAVREALFEVAARLPGTLDVGSVADPLGREGVAVAIDGPRLRTQLVFDPLTANLLAIELYRIEDGSVAGLRSWIAVHPPRVVDTPPRLGSP